MFMMNGDTKGYCVQLNGDKAGDERVTKHYQGLNY